MSNNKHKMLEIINVSKSYTAFSEVEPEYVLKDLSWGIEAGQSVAVTGPSGSGKSTLLNIIGALDEPTAGKVLLDGRDLSVLNEKELAKIRNLGIGFVFQLHHLLPQCTALENVLVPTLAGFDGQDKSSHESRARELLDRVGLGRRLDYRPGQLSGGERQRVAVVRALINRPKLLLADEPTGSLDHAAAVNLAELLCELNREQQVTLILATHSRELAERMAEVWKLENGKLVNDAE